MYVNLPEGISAGGGGMPLVPESAFQFGTLDELRKALTLAGYGTDHATLSGGGALRLQSIEPSLLAIIQEDGHFVLTNKLPGSKATATVDEFTTQDSVGSYPGGGFNSEAGPITEANSDYNRHTDLVKYQMQMRQVSLVAQLQGRVVDVMAQEKLSGARAIMTSVEWCNIYGDAAVNPLEWDGAIKKVTATNDADLIVDAGGESVSYVFQEMVNAAATVALQGRYGVLTDYFCSVRVQAEIDQKLDVALRVAANLNAPVTLGTPVRGIITQKGTILANPDVFIEESGPPFSVRFPAFATANVAPTTVAGVPGANAASKFATKHAGLYYYAAEAIGPNGHSQPTVSAQVTVAAGEAVVLTITHGVDAAVTGFAIFRGRRNGTNAASDLREMVRVPRSGGATTVYTDLNRDIPGTSPILSLNLKPGALAITMRRFLDLTMWPLYATNTAAYRWAQLYFGYLRVAKPRQHVIIKNVLPAGATWKPF